MKTNNLIHICYVLIVEIIPINIFKSNLDMGGGGGGGGGTLAWIS